MTSRRVRRMRRQALAIGIGATAAITLLGCAPTSGSGASPIATFKVVDQTFRVELATDALVKHAQALLDGSDDAPIPVGRIVRDDPSVNAPWSWHIDPATLEFADFTTEVCDGLPEYVEDGTLTSDTYCPWIAKLIDIEYPKA
ncbi:MAG: hypothetical protein ABWX82_01940 [Leifsonia sp.]